MLSYLADFEHIWGPLRLFRYITFRSFMGGATCLFIAYFLAPYIIAKLRSFKASQAFRDESEVGKLAQLHAKKVGTPTIGGLIIYFSVSFSTLLWAVPNVFISSALFVYTGLTIVGFIDDYLKITQQKSGGLSGRYKLFGQAFVTVVSITLLLRDPASAEFMRQLYVPFAKEPILSFMPLWLMIPFLFLVLAGSSNAINLTDGVDGLAIGCTVTVALAFAIMTYVTGHATFAGYLFLNHMPGTEELTILCSCIVAGSLAFLWYNCHPAEVFMGDTGSLALGGLIGIIAFMVQQPFTLIIVGGIFVIEATSVILQVSSFKSRGKRIFRMAPIHHHFELKGWAETKVVIRFWILSLIFALAGLATLKLR